jgi:hypothetical protein|nr:hypothetical protein [Kofleriaceae bacterium]
MTTELAKTRDYLSGQRRNIIARAVLGSLAGAVPVPFLDDMALETIVGSGYKQLAAAHHVDLEPDAVKVMVHGKSETPKLFDMAASGIAYRMAGVAARRMLAAIAAINRARKASRTFVSMTLFEHYCARLHTGLAIDAATAYALREEIARAIDHTPGALAFHPFRRGLVGAARAALRAPIELADLASRGAVRKLLRSGTPDVHEAEAVDVVELAVDAELQKKGGFLARTVASVEAQLSSEVNPFLDAAIASFDLRWRARVAAGTDK